MSQKKLAEEAGISTVMVHKLVSGKSKKTAELVPIARVLRCSPDYLLTGVHDSQNHASEAEPPTVTQIPSPARLVPLISSVQAGDWCEAVDPYPAGEGEVMLPVDRSLVSAMILAGMIVDGRRGGLVIDNEHIFAFTGHLEGGEYIVNHVAFETHSQRLFEINSDRGVIRLA